MTSKQIKKLRSSLKLSQAKLAIRLGVSKRTVENWEQGLRAPGEDNLIKLEELKKGGA